MWEVALKRMEKTLENVATPDQSIKKIEIIKQKYMHAGIPCSKNTYRSPESGKPNHNVGKCIFMRNQTATCKKRIASFKIETEDDKACKTSKYSGVY